MQSSQFYLIVARSRRWGFEDSSPVWVTSTCWFLVTPLTIYCRRSIYCGRSSSRWVSSEYLSIYSITAGECQPGDGTSLGSSLGRAGLGLSGTPILSILMGTKVILLLTSCGRSTYLIALSESDTWRLNIRRELWFIVSSASVIICFSENEQVVNSTDHRLGWKKTATYICMHQLPSQCMIVY